MTTQPKFSENAQIILAQRYLMKDEDGEPIEDAHGLLMRVAAAVAKGQPSAIKRSEDVQPSITTSWLRSGFCPTPRRW